MRIVIKVMMFNQGMHSCYWQLGSVTLTAARSVVVSYRSQSREPTVSSKVCDSSVNK